MSLIEMIDSIRQEFIRKKIAENEHKLTIFNQKIEWIKEHL